MSSIRIRNHHPPLFEPAPQEGVSLSETDLVLGEEPRDEGGSVGSGRWRGGEEGAEEDVGWGTDLHEHGRLGEGSEEERVGLGDEHSETGYGEREGGLGQSDASFLELDSTTHRSPLLQKSFDIPWTTEKKEGSKFGSP